MFHDIYIKVFYFYCIDNKINHIAIHDPRLNEGDQINFTFDGRNVSMPLIPTTVLGLIINTNTNPEVMENLVSSNTDWKGINKRLQENKLRHDRYYYYTKDNYKSGSERDILFTCYNRQPRVNRVLLINEICKQDLYEKGVISCGYEDARFQYYKDLVEEKYVNLFPMQLEDNAIYTNRSINDEVCNQSITKEQLNSFINVISESSSDCNILPLDKDSWTSPFFTRPLGIASLIETTITSPTAAVLRPEPPRTLIHCTLLAPELSATSKLLCICIIFYLPNIF